MTRPTIATAVAPVAPEIMPLLPPNIEVISPTKKAAYRPTNGSTCATKAKAIASGTRAKATVNPDSISALGFFVKSNFSKTVLYRLAVSDSNKDYVLP